MSEALQRIEQPGTLDAPARKRAIDELLNKVALVMETMDRVMQDGVHYGKIPGAGDKKVLYKAGAEKLGLTFHLKPSFEVTETDLGNHHRNFRVICTLTDGAEGVGSCSTLEKKYRYRKKYENGKPVGQMENEDPADCWNTCLKMAKKRAFVDAIITSTSSSDILTQDVEEAIDAADATATEKPVKQAIKPVAAPAVKADEPSNTEKWKTYFLDQVAKKIWGIWAWQWAIGKGYLKESDNLASIAAENCPQNKDAYAKAMTEIKAVMDSFPKGISQELDEAYTKAHLAELGPQEPAKPTEAWKTMIVPKWSKHAKAGLDTFGKLSKNQLWWWCVKWQPTGFKGKDPPQEDLMLRAQLDKLRDQYGFTESEEDDETKKQTATAQEMSPSEDDVPF